jgi:hypothetical protein
MGVPLVSAAVSGFFSGLRFFCEGLHVQSVGGAVEAEAVHVLEGVGQDAH